MASPVVITAKVPNRRVMAGADIVEITPAAAAGRSCRAARVGERPRTSWRYWVTKNVEPAKPTHVSRLPVMATRNLGTANSERSIIGTGRTRWRRTKAQPATSPMTRDGATTVAHPRSATIFIP